jgi:hypothetical protein
MIPLSKVQLKQILKKQKDMVYVINNEIELADLIMPNLGASSNTYMVYTLHPLMQGEIIKLRYKHIKDILVDSETQTISLTHEHSEIFPERYTVKVKLVQTINIVEQLNINMTLADGISISNLGEGRFLVGEDDSYTRDGKSKGIAVKTVNIPSLNEKDIKAALSLIDATLSTDYSVVINGTIEKGEKAKEIISYAIYNSELEDHTIIYRKDQEERYV